MTRGNPNGRILPLLTGILLLLWHSTALPGTTGKITGKVRDSGTNEALPGANIVLEGTRLGAATNIDGYFVIINISPGSYTLNASLVGYHPARMTEVRVQVDLTTNVEFTLTESSVDIGEEVVVVAERPLVQRDLTSTSAKVSADEIRLYPVEEVSDLVNLQAGVVNGHFRGGRIGEVLYMVDGIPVTDLYSREAGVTAETNAIEELEVISGTFNAEYGQAMSGVVNQVTKTGGDHFSGSFSTFIGDYVTSDTELFMNAGDVNPTHIYDFQGSLGGPLIGESRFFLSGRHFYNEGYLYGQRRFLPTDSSNFSSNDPNQWYVGESGDGAFVSFNPDRRSTFQAKVTIPVMGSSILKLLYLGQKREYRFYMHEYKYNPDGTFQNFTLGHLADLSFTAVFSPTTFLEIHGSWYSNRNDSYVYEDPYDPRYPDYRRALAVSGSAFLTGGAEMIQYHWETRYVSARADIVSQVTPEHQIKGGVEGRWNRLWVHNFGIRNDQATGFKPIPVEHGNSQFAHAWVEPRQYAAYVQDKMEFDRLIVNLGVRFDYFKPNADVLLEQLRLGEDPVTTPAEEELQFSPRFGLAYPITDRGVLHLSYGHFFQVPPFELLYMNTASYNINVTESFQVGNPGLLSQRTIAYELGLQQQLTDDLKIDVVGFYKDMRNLIGTEVFDIGNGTKYSQYVNRDHGNSRGFIISLTRRPTGFFSGTIDYTFQIAEGNASDPNSVYLDNQTDPPVQSQKQLAPLDWDRTHTLNFTATFGARDNYAFTLIGRFGSGLPYTPAFQNQRTGLLNSENRPLLSTVDLYATKFFAIGSTQLSVFLKIYNLFDTRNELEVFTDTGRATSSLAANYEGQPRGINTIEEYYRRPDFFSEPRRILIGAAFNF
ncbi:MAG: TonB-dependent receptor [Bacteroidota bacterium]